LDTTCSIDGAVPEACVKALFKALVEEGEALKARDLVDKYGRDQHSSYVAEIISALVAGGELGAAVEVSNGNAQGCSEEMRALIEFLGGSSVSA
jgi:hypothetical protein